MNNAAIIFNKRFELMEAGVIGTTGRKMQAMWTDDDGNETVKEVMEPEQIHTYKGWLEMGYQVKKGEKTRARFTIWNYTKKMSKKQRAALEAKGVTPDTIDAEAVKGHYYTKEACFFAASQVEKITEQTTKQAPRTRQPRQTVKEQEKLLPVLYTGLMLPAVA